MRLPSKWAVLSGTGVLSLATALAFSSLTIAGASHVKPDKKNCSKATACITYTNSSFGAGVQGVSLGFSPSTYAVGAIQGSAGGANGAYAISSGRNGGFFENTNSTYYTLFGYADASGTYPLGVQNIADGGYFYVDSVGDGVFSGSVFSALRTRDGHPVGSFASTATRAQVEDVGTGRVVAGHGSIQFDANFARAIDLKSDYQVFLTPGGDNRGLYVANKSSGGFEVREAQGGRSTLSFDYRVVAHPLGASHARLPEVRMPRMQTRAALGRAPQ
jgi:hypothetical protein